MAVPKTMAPPIKEMNGGILYLIPRIDMRMITIRKMTIEYTGVYLS